MGHPWGAQGSATRGMQLGVKPIGKKPMGQRPMGLTTRGLPPRVGYSGSENAFHINQFKALIHFLRRRTHVNALFRVWISILRQFRRKSVFALKGSLAKTKPLTFGLYRRRVIFPYSKISLWGSIYLLAQNVIFKCVSGEVSGECVLWISIPFRSVILCIHQFPFAYLLVPKLGVQSMACRIGRA